MLNLLPEIQPVNERDQLAQLFNLYMDGLGTYHMMARPCESMAAYMFAPNDDPRREHRIYQLMLLGRCLRDLHWCAFQALELLEKAFVTHSGDLHAFAIAQRLETIDACGSDEETDWEEDGLDADGKQAWKVTHKEDEEALAPYTLHAELASFFPGSDVSGEHLGSSSPEAYSLFTTIVRSQTDFSFRKMWGSFAGQEVRECRVGDDGQVTPIPLADQIEDELNQDIKNAQLADGFESALHAFGTIAQVYARACSLPDYLTLYISLTRVLYGPDAVVIIPPSQ